MIIHSIGYSVIKHILCILYNALKICFGNYKKKKKRKIAYMIIGYHRIIKQKTNILFLKIRTERLEQEVVAMLLFF